MDYKADIALGTVSAGVSRIEGLYTKLAQKHGVPYGVIQVLYVLVFNNSVTQKQISEICEIPKQTVNNVIKQLKEDNHIVLVSGNGDKREKIIQLTPLGKTYSQDLLKPFFEINEKVVERIGIDLIHQLSKGLAALGDSLEMEMELKADREKNI